VLAATPAVSVLALLPAGWSGDRPRLPHAIGDSLGWAVEWNASRFRRTLFVRSNPDQDK
jgi:hypothetical protein